MFLGQKGREWTSVQLWSCLIMNATMNACQSQQHLKNTPRTQERALRDDSMSICQRYNDDLFMMRILSPKSVSKIIVRNNFPCLCHDFQSELRIQMFMLFSHLLEAMTSEGLSFRPFIPYSSPLVHLSLSVEWLL